MNDQDIKMKTDKKQSRHTYRSLFFSLIWRDLWRNPRRTVITAASVFFAVFFATLMRSFQEGTYDNMIQQTVGTYSGYLQIQHPDYKDDPCLENSFFCSDELLDSLIQIPNIKGVAPRVESFALISSGLLSKGAVLSGISSRYEQNMSNPEKHLVKYRFTEQALEQLISNPSIEKEVYEKCRSLSQSSYTSFQMLISDLELDDKDSVIAQQIADVIAISSQPLADDDDGILISDRLARYLKVHVGDSVVLMGQGYQGSNAAGIFSIKGIIKMPSPDLDNKMIYMSLHGINLFLGLSGGEATSVAINLENPNQIENTRTQVENRLDTAIMTLYNWDELNPGLQQQIDGDKVSGYFIVALLYMIVFFGIFGTITMMIAERTREFGMMVSIGMKRLWLTTIFCAEMFLLGIIGLATGLLATVPIILMGHYYPIRFTGTMAHAMIEMGIEPIMPLALFDSYFYTQAVVVAFMLLTACMYPIRKLLKLDALKALRS
jgi:ABC-type lipoprotein release transport system permease subunit